MLLQYKKVRLPLKKRSDLTTKFRFSVQSRDCDWGGELHAACTHTRGSDVAFVEPMDEVAGAPAAASEDPDSTQRAPEHAEDAPPQERATQQQEQQGDDVPTPPPQRQEVLTAKDWLVPKSEIERRLNLADLKAPWNNDGPDNMVTYQWHPLWPESVSPPNAEDVPDEAAEAVKAAMSGAAGVLMCDQLMWHPKERKTAVEDTGILTKNGRCTTIRAAAFHVVLREQCSTSVDVNNFVMGISDRFFIVFPHGSSEIQILVGLYNPLQTYGIYVRVRGL